MNPKIKIIRDLLDLKEQIYKMRYEALTKAKVNNEPVDTNYTRVLRIFSRIVQNQIDQIEIENS
jgi:hypothetical protein